MRSDNQVAAVLLEKKEQGLWVVLTGKIRFERGADIESQRAEERQKRKRCMSPQAGQIQGLQIRKECYAVLNSSSSP